MDQKLRLIALQRQGLTTVFPFGKGSQACKHALEHLGYIQIDTLSVIERAHHHTLWTRIPDYKPDYLHKLVRERDVFEYWFHAASYLPMNDYRFALPKMSAIKRGEISHYNNVDIKSMRDVYDRIKIDGPLRARDFGSKTKISGKWWNWKPSKRALEKLFMQGDLMISDRVGMEKVYDLTERVLPDGINTSEPTLSEFAEYLLNVSLKANGFTTLKQLMYLRTGHTLREALNMALQKSIDQGLVVEIAVDGLKPIYAIQNIFDSKINRPVTNVRLLSPFDNAIIHRDKVQQLFSFDYRLECYTPKEKRQFGYFCLPILYKDNLIGRVDCKTHRKTGDFELANLHIESKTIDLDHFIPLFTKVVFRFATFNNCHTIRVSNVRPKKLTRVFREALRL